jgi:hypothetical protein
VAEFGFVDDFPVFAGFVKRRARYVMNAKQQLFLEAVLETCRDRETVMKKKTVLWRAQLGHDWRVKAIVEGHKLHVEGPFKAKRMKPLPDRAKEGRVNPKGIPCLYCATEIGTAMSEVRPWIGSYVSAARFVLIRDLRFVDCSSETEPPISENPEAWAWWYINRAFSEPVTDSDDVADYAPTQVLAEAFRSAGYEGIIYGSKLGSGSTVAVFDMTAARLVNCHLYKVRAVNFNFSPVAKSDQ